VHETPIVTARLELHHIPVPGLIALFEDKDDRLAIAARDITNPHQNLIASPGPLAWRVPQVKESPEVNKWFVRFIVLASTREILGSTSFHGAPDSSGMIEIGLGIEDAFQRQGFAKEALKGMWLWACEFPEVKTLRYTVSPDNLASIKVIEYFGFAFIGQQMDEIDGPENIYEESAQNFKERWGVLNER
jgi:ribosomal-protein-alanine N-acetyltransferase